MSIACNKPQLDDRCRQLVENATDVIYWLDAHGRFTAVNPTAARVMGYTKEQILGRHFTELITPEHRAAALQFYKQQFRDRRPYSYYEFPAVTAAGGIVWFGQNVRALADEAGHVLGFEAVARDITERKALEADRERLIVELREALGRVKVLRGLLPICSCCKMVRNDGGDWESIETYVTHHSEAEFTHGLCPACLQRYYAEMDAEMDEADPR